MKCEDCYHHRVRQYTSKAGLISRMELTCGHEFKQNGHYCPETFTPGDPDQECPFFESLNDCIERATNFPNVSMGTGEWKSEKIK